MKLSRPHEEEDEENDDEEECDDGPDLTGVCHCVRAVVQWEPCERGGGGQGGLWDDEISHNQEAKSMTVIMDMRK